MGIKFTILQRLLLCGNNIYLFISNKLFKTSKYQTAQHSNHECRAIYGEVYLLVHFKQVVQDDYWSIERLDIWTMNAGQFMAKYKYRPIPFSSIKRLESKISEHSSSWITEVRFRLCLITVCHHPNAKTGRASRTKRGPSFKRHTPTISSTKRELFHFSSDAKEAPKYNTTSQWKTN